MQLCPGLQLPDEFYQGTLNRDFLIAVTHNNLESCNALVNDIDIHHKDPYGYLHCVSTPEMVDFFCRRNIDVDVRSMEYEATPLHMAVCFHDADVVERHVNALLDRGANPQLRVKIGYTVLDLAALHGKASTIELLLARGVSFSSRHSLVQLAVCNGNVETAEFCLRHDAGRKLFVRDAAGVTAFDLLEAYQPGNAAMRAVLDKWRVRLLLWALLNSRRLGGGVKRQRRLACCAVGRVPKEILRMVGGMML
jgi:hypothetical protein